MSIRSSITNLFAKHPTEQPKKLPTDAVAWSHLSSMYSSKYFMQYNPDTLLGRQGFGVYKQMMLDEQVKAVVKFKRDAVTSREYFFELDAEEAGITEDEAQLRIDVCNAILNNMTGSWMDAMNYVTSAMYNGFSMTEKLFELFNYKGKQYWGIERLRLKPFDSFYFNVDDFGNLEKIIQKISGKEQEIDPSKFIHFVINPDIDEHYGQSDIREAYDAWFAKTMITRFRNMWLERHAGGFRVATIKEGSGITALSAEYATLQNIMTNLNSSAGIVMPSWVEINSDYPSNNVAFKEAIEDYNMAIAKALLVPSLLGITPQGDTGSYAQSTTQLEAFLWTLEADTLRLEDTLNEQLFRQLGEVNFGEGAWPKFRFKPASGRKKMELVTLWKDLVASGAVSQSVTDEKFIRDMLDFPEKYVEEEIDSDGVATPVNPTTALNGAQVTSLLQIVEKVSTGQLPRETGLNIIVAVFPLNKAQADELLGEVGNGFEPTKEEPESTIPEGEETGRDDSGDTPDPADESGDDNNGSPDKGDDSSVDKDKEETVQGKRAVTTEAFTNAMKRVDFAVIDNRSSAITAEGTDKLGDLMGEMIAELVDGMSLDPAEVTKMKASSSAITKIRKHLKATLREGWDLGIKHAAVEIDKANGKTFVMSKPRKDFVDQMFFDLKSFKIAGDLSSSAVSIMQGIILNGIKGSKSLEVIKRDIYEEFASKGMLSEAEASEALGEALNVANPDARLATIVRTNVFESINEARFSYFTDPALDGFVEALEYSAIMDSRTTEICKHLDEKIYATDSDVWEQYRPPNHFNCRSLLIPVLEMDEWSESNKPSDKIKPQAGFK